MRTATPASPSRTPKSLIPVALSLLRKKKARITTKMGSDAFAIAATPESIRVSPQAIRVNGSAVLTMPRITAAFVIARS